MIEWLGGTRRLIELSVPLFGLALVFGVSRVAGTNGSERYFMPAFGCWFGHELLLALAAGTLVTVPTPVGIVGSILLLAGFLGLTAYGFLRAGPGRVSSGVSP